MKKALSVTLNGIVFQIEDDAYLKLDKYLNSIKAHYEKNEAEEIVFDMEASIAEKFSQRLEKGKSVITILDVDDVILEMGSVDEFDEDEKKEDLGSNLTKRLFRDTDDVILGGVCSGIAVYFGIDPLFVRIFFIVLTLLWGSGILVYLALWIIVPEAKTSSQKLEMKGRPVNLEEIQELTREKSKKIKEGGKQIIESVKKKKGVFYQIINFPVKIIGFLFKALKKIIKAFFPVLSIFLGIVFLVGFLATILGITVSFSVLIFNINSPFIVSDLPLAELASSWYYYFGVLSIYFIVLIPLLFLVLLSITMIRRKNSFSQFFSTILIVIWMLSVTGLAISATDLAPRINAYIESSQKEVVTKDIPIDSFSNMNLSGIGLNVKLVESDNFSMRAIGREDDLDLLIIENVNDELVVKKESRDENGKWCFMCLHKDVEVLITAPYLNSLTGAGYADIKVEGFSLEDTSLRVSDYVDLSWHNLSVNNLSLDTSSYSDIKLDNLSANNVNITQTAYSDMHLNGKTNELTADISRYSHLEASEFRAIDVVLNTSNYSSASVLVENSLTANAKNYSNITYNGNPIILNVSESNYSSVSN
jgi:phage shock protein PspC (stress-responsive transcriptional regulator)